MKARFTTSPGARKTCAAVLLASITMASMAGSALAQTLAEDGGKLVQLDYNDVELTVVIETIARLTGRNFIYDDRVRGRVTIVSPTQVTLEQAYAVFESVLQVKGFTTLEGPGGVVKIIPVRAAKESSIETVRGGKSPNRDRYVTRLIPLRYISAQEISNTLKPLIAKDASLVAYAPTNTIILTDTSSNIRRILSILDAIDVETYREELAVIAVHHADAATLGQQISEIYGADVATTGSVQRRSMPRRRGTPTPAQAAAAGSPGSKVRLITDQRTNSLIVLAPRQQIDDVRALVHKLDVPVSGSGHIHVYYLKHADSEELAQTLQALLSGQPRSAGGPAGAAAPAQQLRSAVSELATGISVTADPSTNALVIQASKEGYETLISVIQKLDIRRPQVLVEALVMEVLVSDSLDLGFGGLLQLFGKWNVLLEQGTEAVTTGLMSATGAPFFLNAVKGVAAEDETTIGAILRASAGDSRTNVLSAPHILTSDNEEAEIKIGDNIPIVTNRVESAVGTGSSTVSGLANSVSVERQDIGVTLRVTPQISEGDTLRLEIFQEITGVNETLGKSTGDAAEVGVALSNRQIENTVVVADGETVVIGGLISETDSASDTHVPWFGKIPILGWAFKSTKDSKTKTNLLVFLTPHIIRTAEDLEAITMRKREEFRARAGAGLDLSKQDREKAKELGLDFAQYRGSNPVRGVILGHAERYPLERMRQIEAARAERQAEQSEGTAVTATRYGVRAGIFRDEVSASRTLTELVDAGYDGTLASGETDGALLYEIMVGPYDELPDAERASALLRGMFGLDPSITVLPEESP